MQKSCQVNGCCIETDETPRPSSPLQVPNIQQLEELASKINLTFSFEELNDYQDAIKQMLPQYAKLDDFFLDEKRDLEYPRSIGHIPCPEENTDEHMPSTALLVANIQQLKVQAKVINLNLSPVELNDHQGSIKQILPQYGRLDEFFLDEKPNFKYPRTTGHNPYPEENKFNAWSWKTDIKGAADGKLKGYRVALKDSIFVADVPAMIGSSLMEGFMPKEDATVVKSVLKAGGHILGKSSCAELGKSGCSFPSATGPVLNPYDITRCSGGSSSGNVVLLCTNEVDLAIGSDQAGSIRTPSSWTGTVGLKPTYGIVPYTGVMSMDPSLDHLGPTARTVKDCALLLEIMAGYDNGSDPRQQSLKDINVVKYSKLLSIDLNSICIGVLQEGFDVCNPGVAKIVTDAIGILSDKCGAVTDNFSLPFHKDVFGVIWFSIMSLGFYKNCFQNAGTSLDFRGHQNIEVTEHLRTSLSNKSNDMSTTLKFYYLLSAYVEQQHGMQDYVKAQRLVPKLISDYNQAFDSYDVIVMPTLPCTALKLPPDGLKPAEYVRYSGSIQCNTAPFNVTGHPAISLNAGFLNGLPVGIQIVGKHWDDATVLKVAYALEQNLTVSCT